MLKNFCGNPKSEILFITDGLEYKESWFILFYNLLTSRRANNTDLYRQDFFITSSYKKIKKLVFKDNFKLIINLTNNYQLIKNLKEVLSLKKVDNITWNQDNYRFYINLERSKIVLDISDYQLNDKDILQQLISDITYLAIHYENIFSNEGIMSNREKAYLQFECFNCKSWNLFASHITESFPTKCRKCHFPNSKQTEKILFKNNTIKYYK